MIDILIPTYNRCNELAKNLTLLEKEVNQYQLYASVKIIISDNASTDQTTETVKSYSSSSSAINVEYIRQNENLGLEKNAVAVLDRASADYVMFLGDDDFLPSEYLKYCVDSINSIENLGYIIPGLTSLAKNGTRTVGRIEKFKQKRIDKGYTSLLQYSHLGHQMSGILMKRKDLLKNYLSMPEYRNIYLFIYFLANRIISYHGVYAPKFKVLVSVENAKNWSYNEIGLLDEVFKSYYPFINQLGEEKVSDLMIRFIMLHSYRIDFSKGFWVNYKYVSSASQILKTYRMKLFILLTKEYTLRKFRGIKG